MKSAILTFLTLALMGLIGQAQNTSTKAFFGVHSNSVSKKKAAKLDFPEPYGAYVTNVIANTTAEKEGFQPFDYIYQIDDKKFEPHQSLGHRISDYRSGDKAMVYFVRNGDVMEKEVSFGREADVEYQERSRSEDPFLGVESNHDRVPAGIYGVAVDIVDNSTAADLGIKDGDIITRINGYPTIDWHDVGTGIDMLEVGEPIKVTYVRDEKVTTVTGPVKSLAATKDGAYSHGSWSYSYSYNYDHWKNQQTEENEEAIAVEETFAQDMEIEMEDMPEEDAEQMKAELGIDMPVIQNLQIEELTIFPNPTESMFNLRFELPESGPTAIRIYNSFGQMIYANDMGNFSGSYNGRIDLGDQPAGTYYVMVQQGKFSVSKKLIVTRS